MNTTIALNARPAVRRDERNAGHRFATRAIRPAAFGVTAAGEMPPSIVVALQARPASATWVLTASTDGHEQAVEIQLSFLRRHLLDGSRASAAHAPASLAAAA
jgi:hypothetical protein